VRRPGVRDVMTENICRYSGNRDQAIVSYLYSEDGGFDPAERAAFDAHLAICERCRSELAAFEEVRRSLGRWSPPEPARLRSRDLLSFDAGSRRPPPVSRGFWREIPAWAQVGAALLCLGVGAGMANLTVRYDANGLELRTGWSAGPWAPVARDSQPVAGTVGGPGNDVPWRADLTALEQRLRADLRQPPPAVVTAATTGTSINNDALRRVRALVDESERRQQRELALRLAEAVSEMNAQRQADLVRIDRNIGAMQNNTGREMLRQRNEMLNYVSLRTASRPQ
jgi:putative zinc finger protein